MKKTIHKSSDVQTQNIGLDTIIWQYCTILPGAIIGRNCNICANVFIENNVKIGNNVTIKNGVQIWDGITIGNDVFIGPNATFCNDLKPRSKCRPKKYLETVIEDGVSIGANATILPGIKIGFGAMVGAGAVVTKDVPSNAIIVGNPGGIKGYIGTSHIHRNSVDFKEDRTTKIELDIGGCTLYKLPKITDMRGNLSVAESWEHIPFEPVRCFWVFDVPSSEVRGEHAHKKLKQYLICLKGSVNVVLDDGKSRKEVILNEPNIGLYIPPLIWGVQYKYSKDAVLLVMASAAYDSSDYLRKYDEFLDYRNGMDNYND